MDFSSDDLPYQGVLLFPADHQNKKIGTICRGANFVIRYESSRLPENRDTYNGSPAYSIIAHYRFSSDGPGAYVGFPHKEGLLESEPIYVPHDAKKVELWFQNNGRSGRSFYDSNFGHNYHFSIDN
eukprot:TRINITY_DN7689_c0_g1_i1.p1 TRINITY_DN7689_c0_g1~~TRINITY_DN7689_c0_g1_i1.p1  ORF type:complete len:126 (+),score=14.44 TRINITY_DN7689_c0_g1_i1:79-456(+)